MGKGERERSVWVCEREREGGEGESKRETDRERVREGGREGGREEGRNHNRFP